VDDAHIARVIVEGGPSVGLSVAMPPSPGLAGDPEVVAALVAQVRGYRP
jgi:hypothetical protein